MFISIHVGQILLGTLQCVRSFPLPDCFCVTMAALCLSLSHYSLEILSAFEETSGPLYFTLPSALPRWIRMFAHSFNVAKSFLAKDPWWTLDVDFWIFLSTSLQIVVSSILSTYCSKDSHLLSTADGHFILACIAGGSCFVFVFGFPLPPCSWSRWACDTLRS